MSDWEERKKVLIEALQVERQSLESKARKRIERENPGISEAVLEQMVINSLGKSKKYLDATKELYDLDGTAARIEAAEDERWSKEFQAKKAKEKEVQDAILAKNRATNIVILKVFGGIVAALIALFFLLNWYATS